MCAAVGASEKSTMIHDFAYCAGSVSRRRLFRIFAYEKG